MAFFIPFIWVAILTFTFPVLFTKKRNYGMKEKKMFCSYGSFRVPSYKGGKKILYLDTIAFLDTTHTDKVVAS